ncbi:MAG: hypothetical protein ACYDGM_09290 [Vulcanimicrobiaceae bacterium]
MAPSLAEAPFDATVAPALADAAGAAFAAAVALLEADVFEDLAHPACAITSAALANPTL